MVDLAFQKVQGSEVDRRMAGEELKLIGAWLSPFVRRVQLALKIKGISYEYVEEDLSNKSPLLLQYNPVHKKVPVLLHNGKPVVESLVILEYIEETWKQNPILPEDPYQRATARFWAKFIDEKCLVASWKACWTVGEEQQKAIGEAMENLKTLEKALEGNKLFGGESIGLVDIVANFLALWLGVFQEVAGINLLDQEKLPVLNEWIQEFLNCDVVKECLPPRDKLLAYFQATREAILSTGAPVYRPRNE